MKILVKIWWSLIAPKNWKWLDLNYLKSISSVINNIDEKFFIIHWTWNIWHWRVKNLEEKSNWISRNDLIKKNYLNWKKIIKNFFNQVNEYFKKFSRLKIEYFLQNQKFYENWLIWWDILKDWTIISSDDIFQFVLENDNTDLSLILTDVDWILDENKKVLTNIYNTKNIKFWNKKNDVTWAMKSKVEKIIITWKKVVICNWYDTKNIMNWIKYWVWKWTLIW